MSRRTVGILGGMGPEATVDLFAKIVRATPAQRDQDHLRILVDCNPQIPDRTAAILGQAPSPGPLLRAGARRLESWGAQLLVIPCNTAHHYYHEIAAAVSIPVLNIMWETASAIKHKHPGVERVGVLASTGTLDTGLYRRSLADVDLTEVQPGPELQELVMKAIYGIKAGHEGEPRQLLRQAAMGLIEIGAQAVIAGCTEVPIALHAQDVSVPYIDATMALAGAAVRQALGRGSTGDEKHLQ
jgi:aspartate racemase